MIIKIIRLNYDFVVDIKSMKNDRFCVYTERNQNVFVIKL